METTEVTDAYQEYVQRRRDDDPLDKMVSLTLSVADLSAIFHVIAQGVDGNKTLTPQQQARWESILRSIGRAIDEIA